MFPPVSGREVDPSPPPPPSPPEDDFPIAYGPARAARSQRFRIVGFGILVGGFIAVLYASAMALLRLIAGAEAEALMLDRWDRFRAPGERFLGLFAGELTKSAPLWILIAALAAGVQALIRRTAQEARVTRELVRHLLPRPPRSARPESRRPDKSGDDLGRPPRGEINMELDAPYDRE